MVLPRTLTAQALAVDAALLPADRTAHTRHNVCDHDLQHHGELRDVSVLVAPHALRSVGRVYFWLV